jgi:actin-related protein
VRQLRSRFEGAPGSSKSKKFMVMASLTRRGAVAMSKSLQNIDIGDGNDDYIKETKKKKSHSSSKRPDAESVFKPADGKLGVDDQSLFASTDLKFEKRGFSKLSAATSVFNRDHSSSESSSSDRNSTQKKKKAPQAPMLKFGDKEEEQKNKKLNNSQDDEEEEEVDDSNMLWDPIRFVARMYRLPKLSENEVAKNSADAAYVQGFLERLPAGKKKSTLWNSWKKHYFVAQKGFLNVYSDDSCAVILERIELFGGQVDFTDSHILGVQDRRGHYLVLKCPSAEDAQRWERAVRANIGQDFAKTFVTPSPRPKAPSFFTDVLVIDFGGASVRAGIATTFPTLPKIFFPSVMAVEHLNEQAKYFGLDTFAPEVRSRCRLSHPIVPSQYADKYSVDQTALQGILEKIFKDLNLEPSHYQIQLSVPRAFGDKTKIAIASMLFDEFGVKALNMGHQSVFAFYSYSARSGIMVDLGERMDVVPIVDGYKVSSGISRSTVGGSEMRSKLQHYLLGRNYSLTSFIDSFVTRYAVEQLAYMSRHFDRELDAYRQDPAKVDKVVEIASDDSPDAPVKKMELGSERFEACEGLFKPELWGLDQAGVHVLVHKAIKECSMDVRKEVTQSIFLAGGLTLIPGFRERLELEVEKLTPVKPRVHASPYR